MRDVPIEKIREFQETFLDRMRAGHQADALDVLASGKLTEEVEKIIKSEAEAVALQYRASDNTSK
jgi:F-type H+-transporting ATPase subunit alpha